MIPSARLDAEIILAHSVNKPRTWLHAHGDEPLDPRRRDIADARLQLRLERVPIAYIVGYKEFYGRQFIVNPSVLIPRPESETIITELKAWLANHPKAKHLIDVGTGSGALGITAALEHPNLIVAISDISDKALAVAKRNAENHKAKVAIIESDLLDSYPLSPDIILANLPYVDRDWTVSADTVHEPSSALFADNGGLELIYKLIEQAASRLAENGAIILEADPRQHQAISNFAVSHGFSEPRSNDFVMILEKAAN